MRVALPAVCVALMGCAATPDLVYASPDAGHVDATVVLDAADTPDTDVASDDSALPADDAGEDAALPDDGGPDAPPPPWNTCPNAAGIGPGVKCCLNGRACKGDCTAAQCVACLIDCPADKMCCTHGGSLNLTCAATPPGCS